MFIIRDKATGEVWFVGTVYEPLSVNDETGEAKEWLTNDTNGSLTYQYWMNSNSSDETSVSGDVNCDGMVNEWDTVCLERYLTGWNGYDLTEQEKKHADVNEDGEVDKNDSLVLKKYLANEYESLPVKE